MKKAEKEADSIPKNVVDLVGRMFNLVFNRVSMYHLEHPSTQEAIQRLRKALDDGFKHLSPLAVIFDRGMMYVEEEAVDPRINPQRLVGHTKKAGVQSVSFEKGVTGGDIVKFARVFIDTKSHPTADAMIHALIQQGIQRVRINHVFFKKVTTDEEVVDREDVVKGSAGSLTRVLIDTSAGWGRPEDTEGGLRDTGDRMQDTEGGLQDTEGGLKDTEGGLKDTEGGSKDTGGGLKGDGSGVGSSPGSSPDQALWQELLQSLTLSMLVENPAGVSQRLIEAEIPQGEALPGSVAGSGAVMQGIRELRAQVAEVAAGGEGESSMDSIVEAVFQMREELRKGITHHNSQGGALIDEESIQREMDDLTDEVMAQLIREEYRKGQISIKRLAQIIRRMMPDIQEMKRLLPRLKETLLAEGMPLADYLKLIQELERELRSENLAQVLEEGADEIGLSVDDLISEMRKDPKGAAELIAIAAEIRSMGQVDREALSQILVEYVEGVGGDLAMERAQQEGPEGIQQLETVLSQVQGELVEQIRKRLADSSLVQHVRENIENRQEEKLDDLRKRWVLRHFFDDPRAGMNPDALIQVVEVAYPDPSQQGEILGTMIDAMKERGMDPAPLQAALAQMTQLEIGEADPQKVPKGVLGRNMVLYSLQEEFKRARRYRYEFSALMVSVRQAVSLKPVPIGMIQPHEIRNAAMVRLLDLIREVDMLGSWDDRKFLILLPFTGASGAQAVHKRTVISLEEEALTVRNVPMRVKLAMVEETFDKDKVSDIRTMLRRLEGKLAQSLKTVA